MPLLESSKLIATYLLCQTKLSSISYLSNSKVPKAKTVEQYCFPFLKKPTASYILEDLINYAFLTKNKKLAEKLYKFAIKNSNLISKKNFFEILTLKSLLNGRFLELILYAQKAFYEGSDNPRILILVALSSEIWGDVETFYKAVRKLYEEGKDIEKFTDDFFKEEVFPLNAKTIKIGEKLLKILPDEEYFIKFAQRLEQAEKFEEEEKVLKEGIELYPNSKDLQKLLIRYYILTNRVDEAHKLALKYNLERYFYLQAINFSFYFPLLKRYADEALKKYPNDKELLRAIQTKYIFLGYVEGINKLENILFSQKNKDIEDLTLLITAHFVFKGHLNGNEIKFIETFYKKNPQKPEAQLLKILKDLQFGKVKEAKNILNRLKNNYPLLSDYLKTIYNGLYRYFYSKDYDTFYLENPILRIVYLELLYHLKKKIYLSVVENLIKKTKSPKLCSLYSVPAWKAGDLETTLKVSESCLQKFKKDAELLNSVGYLMLLINPKKYLLQAEKFLKEAYKLDPNNPAIYDSLGWLYYYKGEYSKALKWFKKVLEKNSDDPVEYYHIAVLLTHMKQPCKARKYLQKAFELKNNYPIPPEPDIYQKMEELKKKLNNLCSK